MYWSGGIVDWLHRLTGVLVLMPSAVSYLCECGTEYAVRPVTCACGRKFAGVNGESLIRVELTTDPETAEVFVESSIVEPPRRRAHRWWSRST